MPVAAVLVLSFVPDLGFALSLQISPLSTEVLADRQICPALLVRYAEFHSLPGRALLLSLPPLILGSHLNFLPRAATFAAPWQEPLAS